jgi:hypothetical protein
MVIYDSDDSNCTHTVMNSTQSTKVPKYQSTKVPKYQSTTDALIRQAGVTYQKPGVTSAMILSVEHAPITF